MMMVMQMILPHLEVYNEDDDLGDRSLQTEQVGVLDFHRLINNMWTNLRWIHISIAS